MADVHFTDEEMGKAPESAPIPSMNAGEILTTDSGEGRRFPYMDSRREMQRQISHSLMTKRKHSVENGYRKHHFLVTDDLDEFLKDNGGRFTINHNYGIKRYGAYVPFDKKVVDFFASSIKWSTPDSLIYKILTKAFSKGYCLVYAVDKVKVATDFEPIFDTDENVIACINEQGEILANGCKYIFDAEKGYVKTEFLFNIEWYRLVKVDNCTPIFSNGVNLINAYTESMNSNENSLKSFAESILTITGIDRTQGITPEQLQAIGEETINVLAFETQSTISGDGEIKYGGTPNASFIAPPLNTEAREKWSERIRREIFSTLCLPNFDEIAGNVSTDTIRIYLYETIQRAKNLADEVVDELRVILDNPELTYEIDTPQSPNDNMKSLNDITYLSDETKLRLAFPEWSEEKIAQEVARLTQQGLANSEPVALIDNLMNGVA